MRKILILAGALIGGALFSGTPAKAELGCTCVKLGSAPFCTSGITQCTFMGGGVCVLPCDYGAPKMTKHHRHHRHHVAKKIEKKTTKKMKKM
jgi:hypothetical protein